MIVFFLIIGTTNECTSIGQTEECCINCYYPGCKYYPAYKQSLEGLAWHKVLHRLVELKKNHRVKSMIDCMENWKDIREFVK